MDYNSSNENNYYYDQPTYYDDYTTLFKDTASLKNVNSFENINFENFENTTLNTQANMDTFSYPENLTNALRLIEQAIAEEKEDELFYTFLIKNAPTEEDRQILSSIRDNEIKHYDLFHQLYYDITGIRVPQFPGEEFVSPNNYCEGLKCAFRGEENAVVKYRQILYAMQNRIDINMLTEIITDEIRHGMLYLYLIGKNNC